MQFGLRGLLIFITLTFIGGVNATAGSYENPEKLFLKNLVNPSKLDDSIKKVHVSTADAFYRALDDANRMGNTALLLAKGNYYLPKTAIVTGTNVSIIGQGDSPLNVVLRGNGMKETANVDNLFWITGNDVLIENLTLEQAGNHLVQIASERGGKRPKFRNLVFQDAYEQLLKVSFSIAMPTYFSSDGLVESCLFRYTKGIGPNWYIGGIDAHGIQSWLIKNNIFVDIASPKMHIAEHAIHLWNSTKHNVVTGNLIINSDRGIGFGMRMDKSPYYLYSNLGGEISENTIIHNQASDPFADVGIILEDSPDTLIKGNTIQLLSGYPNAIEIRFDKTTNVMVIGNQTNQKIKLRDGGEATLIGNTYID